MKSMIAALILAAILFSRYSVACDCPSPLPFSAEGALKYAEGAELIFLGRVESQNPNVVFNNEILSPFTQVVVSPVEIFRAKSRSEKYVLVSGPGTCTARYFTGSIYLIFAYQDPKYPRLRTSLCGSFLYEKVDANAHVYYARMREMYEDGISALRELAKVAD